MSRPQWFEGIGDFYGTLTARAARAIGYPDRAWTVVHARDVSPRRVAGAIHDPLTNEYLAGCVTVRLHGEQLKRWRTAARRCRANKRRARRIRNARIRRKGF